MLKELFSYREMIFMLVRRDLRGRYKGSVLGFFWTFLNPMLQFAVYAIVFSVIMPVNIDKFYIYLFIGFVPWFFTANSIGLGAMCILTHENMVQKIYFPRMVLPISTVLSGFVNMLLSELIVTAALLVSGIGLSLHILLLPVVMLVQMTFLLGFVLIVSALTVYFRDLAHILEIVVMAWFYATPIVYLPEMLEETFPLLLRINPMAGIIDCYRKIQYYKCMPEWTTLLETALAGVVMVAVGAFVFQKLQRGFAEEL